MQSQPPPNLNRDRLFPRLTCFFLLGELYENGFGVEKDLRIATELKALSNATRAYLAHNQDNPILRSGTIEDILQKKRRGL